MLVKGPRAEIIVMSSRKVARRHSGRLGSECCWASTVALCQPYECTPLGAWDDSLGAMETCGSARAWNDIVEQLTYRLDPSKSLQIQPGPNQRIQTCLDVLHHRAQSPSRDARRKPIVARPLPSFLSKRAPAQRSKASPNPPPKLPTTRQHHPHPPLHSSQMSSAAFARVARARLVALRPRLAVHHQQTQRPVLAAGFSSSSKRLSADAHHEESFEEFTARYVGLTCTV